MKNKNIASRIAMLFLAVIYLIPFYILLIMSMKVKGDYSSKWALPDYFTLQNYMNVWKAGHIPRALMNNLIITLGTVVIVVIVGAMAAYPLARRRTRINTIIYYGIVSLLVLPSLAISSNLYSVMIKIHAIDTYWGIILVCASFSLPIVIFLYTGFISTIPRELEDAARLDGCTRAGVFFRIVLPLLRSTTITVLIFTGQAAWNEYGFALLYLQSPAKQNMSLTLSTFFSTYNTELGWVAAGCVINVIPLIVVFLAFQKYFIKGLTDGAVK